LKNSLEEVMEVVKKFLKEVSKRFKIEKAYVFGSYVKGTWLKGSDIDLVIVSPDFGDIPFLKRLDVLNEIQWRMRIRPFIEVIPLTPSEFKERIRSSAVLMDASKYWIEVLLGD